MTYYISEVTGKVKAFGQTDRKVDLEGLATTYLTHKNKIKIKMMTCYDRFGTAVVDSPPKKLILVTTSCIRRDIYISNFIITLGQIHKTLKTLLHLNKNVLS